MVILDVIDIETLTVVNVVDGKLVIKCHWNLFTITITIIIIIIIKHRVVAFM